MDLTKATYAEMAEVVKAIASEVRRRNPILVNEYVREIGCAYWTLLEISEGEKDNCTSECGPEEV